MTNTQKLDNRLSTVFEMFPECHLAADIGADHGKLALALILRGKTDRVLVTDISRDSLFKAEKLFNAYGVAHRAKFLKGDGLTILQETPDAISICGMGGKTINGILEKGVSHIGGSRLILSPQTEISSVRQMVYRLGYHLAEERCAVSSGRFYIILAAEPGLETVSEEELEIGPCLYAQKNDETVQKYFLWRLGVLSKERNESAKIKAGWYREALG